MYAGCAVEELVTDSNFIEYSSIDLLMRTTLTQDSVWEDLGVTEDSHRSKVAQNLAGQGWNMVSSISAASSCTSQPWAVCLHCYALVLSLCLLQTAVVPMQIKLAPEAAAILQALPLPIYTSRTVVIQVHLQYLCCQCALSCHLLLLPSDLSNCCL